MRVFELIYKSVYLHLSNRMDGHTVCLLKIEKKNVRFYFRRVGKRHRQPIDVSAEYNYVFIVMLRTIPVTDFQLVVRLPHVLFFFF